MITVKIKGVGVRTTDLALDIANMLDCKGSKFAVIDRLQDDYKSRRRNAEAHLIGRNDVLVIVEATK